MFSECFRVLKPDGVLTFTFNAKDIRAWYAVIKAAIKAGFYLDRKGIIYQKPIDNYLNTSHKRYARALHGDFIFTFYKTNKKTVKVYNAEWNDEKVKKRIRSITGQYLCKHGTATTNKLYQLVIADLTLILVSIAENDEQFSRLSHRINLKELDSYFQSYYLWDKEKKVWSMQKSKETLMKT